MILEVSGAEAFVLSFIRALERFDVLDVARSGAVALQRVPATAQLTLTSEPV